MTAKGLAKQANFLFDRESIVAAMVEESVCPDGNEKSSGLLIKSATEVSIHDGRGRATAFLSIRFPIESYKKRHLLRCLFLCKKIK